GRWSRRQGIGPQRSSQRGEIARSGPQLRQECVAVADRIQSRGGERRLLLEVEMPDTGLVGCRQNARPVQRSGPDIRWAHRQGEVRSVVARDILDVQLRDPSAVLPKEAYRIDSGGGHPPDVSLEGDESRVAFLDEDLPSIGLADRREFEVVVVVADADADRLERRGALVQQRRSSLPQICSCCCKGSGNGALDIITGRWPEPFGKQGDRHDSTLRA